MPITADKPLTVKQTKFAAKVADGTPKAVAHREVYKTSEKHRASSAQRKKAVDIAAKPHVAAEIRRLTWLALPCIDDARGMREHSVRVLSDLSRSAASEEVRLKAAMALYKIAEVTLAAANPGAGATEQDKLLSSLRKLYTEVQGGKLPPDRRAAPDPAAFDDAPIDITDFTPAVRLAPEPAAVAAPQEAEPLTFETEGDEPDDDDQEPA